MGIEWKKPTITFYHERLDKPETDAFAVVKAKSIAIETAQDGGFKGEIDDFFVLMGDLDQVSTARGKQDRYVLCWFDDAVEDFRKGSRRLNNVTFPSGLTEMAIEGKRTYKTSFHAQLGKISQVESSKSPPQKREIEIEPRPGFDPGTYGLRSRRSPVQLASTRLSHRGAKPHCT